MRSKGVLGVLVLTVTWELFFAVVGSATATYSDKLAGAEVPPISSSRATFVGVASGGLSAMWRAQITHQPLATGSTVPITGGTFSLLTFSGRKLNGLVTGGSVTVTNRGSGCTDQTYQVAATLSIGSFDGTLTHHRRSLLGQCTVYSATIRGHGLFNT